MIASFSLSRLIFLRNGCSVFQRQYYMQLHNKRHLNQTCDRCERVFESSAAKGLASTQLRLHRRYCRGPRAPRLTCSNCRKTFSKRNTHWYHQQRCDGSAEARCQTCQSVFKNRQVLSRHRCQVLNLWSLQLIIKCQCSFYLVRKAFMCKKNLWQSKSMMKA